MRLASIRHHGSRLILWASVWMLAVAFGCSGRLLRPDVRPHGNFAAVIARGLADSPEQHGPPLAVLFGEGDAIAVDLRTGETRWRRPIRVLGAPAVSGRRVAVPVRGHRLLLLDADTGATIWDRPLPGEALTGITLNDRRVVATVVTGELDPRSLAVALSAADGRTRWTRRSPILLGVPATLGRQVFVPTSEDVVVLAQGRGREVARMRAPPEVGVLGRVEVHGRKALAAGAHAFVDLHGGGQTVYHIDPHTAPAFRVVDGLDPGVGHSDGVAWTLRPSASAGAPREAVLMARRVALGIRLDIDGRPALARWIHRQSDAHELVAVGVDARIATFVRDDGSILRLDLRDGHVVSQLAARGPTLGAVMVGISPSDDEDEDDAAAHDGASTQDALLALLEDPDPRLVPAQRLAIELIWRHERPEVRTTLYDLVQGGIRPETDPITEALRDHARAIMVGPWGPSDEATLMELARALAAARQGQRQRDDLAGTVSRAVGSGSPVVLDELVALLDQPGLDADELVAITRALRDLGDHRAISGVAAFVLRYHADLDVVDESHAMLYALDYLVAQARDDAVDPSASARAREVLTKLTEDRFTVPSLRAFLLEHHPG
jgi:hypothetical protein